MIGGGGREHALAWRLQQSPSVTGVVASPGNPGIAAFGVCVRAPEQIPDYVDLAKAQNVGLTVVGPEMPLVAGIVDYFHRHGLKIVGPTAAAAQLEGSKIFAKQFFGRAGIPTARSRQTFTNEEAVEALKEFDFPLVIKANGLAAGKGVVIAGDPATAQQAIQQLGPALVIEEYLQGEEVSFIGLSNGRALLPFAPTQDHKRVFDGDEGPNTGGMGAICDRRILSSEQTGAIMDRIMEPAIYRMAEESTPFTGFLYAGLMMTEEGPKVLEFNTRLGDPETQALLYNFEGDLVELLQQSVAGQPMFVSDSSWRETSACVVLASSGYPDAPRIGDPISGIDMAESTGAAVFHAGTKRVGGNLLTNGGRVLGVTAGADALPAAVDAAYSAVAAIQFDGMQYRKDIGQKSLKRW